jgi:sterol 3beta-glucosyltransferase
MKIGIQTWGSEGDIRPFIALGAALTKRGHAVELLYTEISDRKYEHIARSLGFTARAIASPVIASREREYEVGLAAIGSRDEFSQGLLIFRELLDPVVEPIYEAGLDLCARSDLLIHHFILHPARAAADKTGTPQMTVAFAHMLAPSRYVHPSGLPEFGPWANRIEWAIACFALNRTLLKKVNQFRRTKGLPPFGDLLRDAWPSHRLNLLASSPAFLDPRPADWPDWNQMCGFLELPPHEHEQLTPEVDAFLDAGPPPVFMGFGSLMPADGPHLEQTVGVFEAAAARADCRAKSPVHQAIGCCSSGARRTGWCFRDAPPSFTTPVPGLHTRHCAPARRPCRCLTSPISFCGPRSCTGWALRRKHCGARSGRPRPLPSGSRRRLEIRRCNNQRPR